MRARSILDGLPIKQLDEVLGGRVERRQFPAGSVVLAEGDSPHEMYVIESGGADVFVSDRDGEEHRIGSVIPGGTLGEMSLFTGEPAAGTVRATSDLTLLVLSESDFDRIATTYPSIYRNIGAIMADRLDRSNRRPLRDMTGRVTVLRDWGAPSLLGYALACSLAWHLRRPVLLIVLDEEPPDELVALDRATPRPSLRARPAIAQRDGQPTTPRADLQLVSSALDFAAETFATRVDDLSGVYEHVLVQVRGESRLLEVGRVVHLAPPDGTVHSDSDRPGSVIRAWSTSGENPRPDRKGVLHVPRLTADAAGRLPDGLLDLTSAAGRSLGWSARDIAGLKVGVALGAGAARGYAHTGVLRVLERAGLPIDYLSGTSIGGAFAGLYALGLTPEEAADAFDRIAGGAFRITLAPRAALLSSRRIRIFTRAIFGENRFEDLEIPLALTAVDLPTGQEIIFKRGLLWPALMASMAIPGIYPPQRMGPHTLVDGGIMNPVPTSVVAEMGADIVIAVRLGNEPKARGEVEALEPKQGGASLFHTILRTIEIMQSKINTETAASGTILISPAFAGAGTVGLRRFGEGRKYIELGEEAAENALPRLAATLPWLRA